MAGAETSRDLVRKLFSEGKSPRVLLLPWVCIHAAKLEQVAVRKMLSDPSLLARALHNAHKLYGYDVVVNAFDPSLEAEACGCPVKWTSERELPVVGEHPPIDHLQEEHIAAIAARGRLPVVLEATRRLKATLGRTTALAGVVTGPFTLAGHLRGRDFADDLDSEPEAARTVLELAKRVCLEVCKSYGELELDLIVLADSTLPRLPVGQLPLAVSVLGPLVNAIRFYNSVPLLLAHGCTSDAAGLLSKIDVDGMVADGDLESELRQAMSSCVVGHGIPSSVLTGSKEALVAHVGESLKGGGKIPFVSTDWQVPYETPPENMHEVIMLVRSTFQQR
jgi:uroporphyrinogen decarboxylase